MNDGGIGARVRHWRLKRGLSQRALADLAGLSQGYIAQIEAGTAPLDRRTTQVALAGALQVSVADLTGQPYDPQTIEHSVAASALPVLRSALVSMTLDRDHVGGRSIGELRAAVDQAGGLHNTCRYDQLVPMLPDLLLDLHAHAANPDAAGMLTWVAYATTFAAKYLGYVDLALLAAQQCRITAARTADPAWTGVAEFALLHAMPPEAKDVARNRVSQVLDTLEPLAAADGRVAQVCGMLHLTAGMCEAIAGCGADAWAHLDEADAIAARTGEVNFAELWFGPTNCAIWRVGVCADLDEGGRVRAMPPADPSMLGSRNRQATYYSDLGRALAQTRGNDAEALAALMRAEAIAPQRVRLSPAVREAVGAMLRRARSSAGGRDLQALARRLGTL